MPASIDTTPEQSSATPRRTPVVVRLLVIATFVVILNETIMINAIPRLMESFRVSEQAAQWVSTAFMLTMAAVIPVTEMSAAGFELAQTAPLLGRYLVSSDEAPGAQRVLVLGDLRRQL